MAMGEWVVDINTENTEIAIAFVVFGEDGIETFKTGMPCENAREYAETILRKVDELEELRG